jgi:hypothetical protein
MEENNRKIEEIEEVKTPPVHQIDTRKEQRNLKLNNYEKLAPKFPWKYVIANNTKGIVVEICAKSPVHACTLIGWKPKKCTLLKTIANITEADLIHQAPQQEIEIVEKNDTI